MAMDIGLQKMVNKLTLDNGKMEKYMVMANIIKRTTLYLKEIFKTLLKMDQEFNNFKTEIDSKDNISMAFHLVLVSILGNAV